MSRIIRLARRRHCSAGLASISPSLAQLHPLRIAAAVLTVALAQIIAGCGDSSVPVADGPRNPPAGLMPAGGIDGGAPPADAGMPGDAGGAMPGDAGGAMPGDAAAAGGEGSGAATPAIPARPKDFADWKEDDYRNAAKASDPRLAKAVEHYASVTEDKVQVAKFFGELLAIKPDQGAAGDGSYAMPGDGLLSTPDASGCGSEEPADAGAVSDAGAAAVSDTGQTPGDDGSYAEQNAGGEQTAAARAMLAWLVANPTPEGRQVLERVLKAELKTVMSHSAAARLILSGLLERASGDAAGDESFELFWTALTDPKKYIATATPVRRNSDEASGDPTAGGGYTDETNAPLTRDSLQRMALQLLNAKNVPELRVRLAEHIIKDSTAKEQKELLGKALLQPRVENLGAQLVLYANPKTSARAKSDLERYFRTYSASGIDRLLRIPSDTANTDPNSPGGGGEIMPSDGASADGGGLPGDGAAPDGSFEAQGNDPGGTPRLTAWDNDEQQMYHDLARLWDPQFISTVEKRVAGLRTLSQEIELLRLAVSLPATPIRVGLHKVVQKDWQTGPAALKEAGIFAREIHDPGLMLVIKAVPREYDVRTAAQKQAASKLRGATEKALKERETKNAWLSAHYDLLRALNRRFYAAATNLDRPPPVRQEPGNQKPRDSGDLFSLAAGPWPELGFLSQPLLGGLLIADPPAPADPNALPLRLPPQPSILAEYHVNWPADLDGKLEGAKIEPLLLHYVRLEQEGRLQSIAGTYARQLSPVANYTWPNGAWLDAQDKGTSPGHKRSFDILILPESAHRDDNAAGDGANPEAGSAGAGDAPSNPRAAAQAQNAPRKYIVEILTIEIPDPTQ